MFHRFLAGAGALLLAGGILVLGGCSGGSSGVPTVKDAPPAELKKKTPGTGSTPGPGGKGGTPSSKPKPD